MDSRGEFMLAHWFKLVFCLALVFLLLPFTNGMIDPVGDQSYVESAMDKNNDGIESEVDATVQITENDNAALNAFAASRTLASGTWDTRGNRDTPDTPELDPKDLPTEPIGNVLSSTTPITGNVNRNEIIWYRLPSFNPPGGQVVNITIRPASGGLIGFVSSDSIHVRIYVHGDFNDNDDFDFGEMILLHQESYRESLSTWDTCWALTSIVGDYYVCVEGQPTSSSRTLTYECTVEWSTEDPPTTSEYNNFRMSQAREILPYFPIINERVETTSRTFN
jgi:hypothetical protein